MNKPSFLKKIFLSPLFISILFFLLLQLPISNYGFNYRDEGYLLNNAQRINIGELPYVNFSLAITPGAFYIQALALKLFNNYAITDRILYMLSVIFVLVLSSKIFKFTKYKNYVYLSVLALVYTGMGIFASYNMYGVVLVMIVIFLFDKLKNNNKIYPYSFLMGLTNALVLIVKQTYGFVFFFSLIFLIFIFIKRKYLFKDILYYLIGSLIIPIIILLFLFLKGVLNKIVYSLFYFALSVKNDRMPFILTSVLFIVFFILIVRYIRNFSSKKLGIVFILFLFFLLLYIAIAPTRIHYLLSFYREVTIYYYLLFFMLPLALITLFIKSKDESKKQIVIVSVEAFSLFLASAFSGRDYTTIVVTAPLYIPLFMHLLTYKSKKKLRFPARNSAIALLLIIFYFPSVVSLADAYGNLYSKKDYVTTSIKELSFIKIPSLEKQDLELVINYINKKTGPDTKLVCIPYCPSINFLSERSNASYFGFFYKFNPEDQMRVIEDLNIDKNAIVVVQRPGIIEKEANYEDANIGKIKSYIKVNYKLIYTTSNFYFYGR